MSTINPPVPASGVGLGYGIAIAVSILVLISTIMLASYACIRVKTGRREDGYVGGGGGRSEDPVVAEVVVDIDSLPKLVLGESRRLPRTNNGTCSICLSEYEPNDIVRCIPDCHHCFHASCVDEWLTVIATCPLCRKSPAPPKGSTPLSDLVPLSSHAR